MKKILLCGVLLLFTGQAFAAKKGKGKAKEADLTSQFFDVIAQSFTLNPRKVIDDSNLEFAIYEVKDAILTYLPSEIQTNVLQILNERRVMQERSKFIDWCIANNDLLKNIVSGQQKKVKELSADVFMSSVVGADGKTSREIVLILLFGMAALDDARGKQSRAFLKMLFESEANKKTQIFKDVWENGFLGYLIEKAVEYKQEAFFFPFFSKLIENDVVDISNADLLNLLMNICISKYDSLFYDPSVINIDLSPYIALMKVIIPREQKISMVNEMVEWMNGGSSWIKEKLSDQQKEIKRKEGQELLSLVIKKDLHHARISVEALFRGLFNLSESVGEEENERFSEADEACKNASFALIDQSVEAIKKTGKDGDKQMITEELNNFILAYEKISAVAALIKNPPYNQELADKVYNVINAFHSIGADLNDKKMEKGGRVHPSLLKLITNRAHLQRTGLFTKLEKLGAKLHKGEVAWFSDGE